ncbi:MAG: hypothetical protein AMXMBFR77_16260 [Phycisphaerales bacterium]|nr:signal peptidase II [Phycisphaerales bacterium]GIK19032.1 MAG: hypothetical protein BroJett004_11960 [Planctomycetota bacterium]
MNDQTTPSDPPAPPPPDEHGTAWRSRAAWITLALAVVASLTADLATKHLAFRHVAERPVTVERSIVLQASESGVGLGVLIPAHEPVVVVPGLLEFTLVLNEGAVFGIGAGWRAAFIALTLIAVGFGVWVFGAWSGPRNRLAHAAVGLVLGGGLGNLYDRLVFACVRDFIHPLPGVNLPFRLRWPGSGTNELWPWVSNVADLLLLIGIGVLVVHVWRRGEPRQKPAITEHAP